MRFRDRWVRKAVCCEPAKRTWTHTMMHQGELIEVTATNIVYQHDIYSPKHTSKRKRKRKYYWRGALIAPKFT